MGQRAPVYLAVVGAGDSDPRTDQVAHEVGREIAASGAVLVCGGLGGVMEAVCRGAKEGGGTTLGILPGSDRRYANDYLDVSIPTGMGEMRNTLIVRCASAVIAIGGEFGTLSEIAFALKTGVPVVGLDTWDLSRPGRASPVIQATSAAEAVTAALRAAQPS